MPNNTPWTLGKIWTAVIVAGFVLLLSAIMGYMHRPGEWFRQLNKSVLSPPGWVFGLVWSILYPLIAVAMIAACYGTDNKWTWALPIANIAVSLMFAPLFFGMHSITSGAMITSISLLLGIAVLTQYATVNDSMLAMGLMIPYLVWLCVAVYLAWFLWGNNCFQCYIAPEKGSCPVSC